MSSEKARQSLEDRKKQLRLNADACDAIANKLLRLDRGPFRDMLVELMGCAPEPAAMREFADKHPDKWAQAVTMMAGLAGFEKGVVVNLGVLNVGGMTDAQLIEEATRAGVAVGKFLSPPGVHGAGTRPAPIDVQVVEEFTEREQAAGGEKNLAGGEGNGFPSSPGGQDGGRGTEVAGEEGRE